MKLTSYKNIMMHRCVAVLLALTISQAALATENPGLLSITGEDIKTTFTAPSTWDTQDWKTAGWATLAVVGTAVVADRPVRDYMCRLSQMSTCPGAGPNSEVTNAPLTTIENFGQTYALGVMGGFYLAGAITDNEKSMTVGQDLVAASISSALVNQSIKVLANRSRPRDNQGNNDFMGYVGLNNNSSFPSGHTTEAFTLASVIASHYDETWVSVASYGTASLVGVARMYHDAHWASDVVASAFIGTYIGKLVVKHNRDVRNNSTKVVVLPLLGPDMTGVQIVGNF